MRLEEEKLSDNNQIEEQKLIIVGFNRVLRIYQFWPIENGYKDLNDY